MHILDQIPVNKQLILYDGVCNFCDNTVQKIIKADSQNLFVFASIQSNIGQDVLKHIGINPNVDSIVLYQPNLAYFVESDAVIEIAKQLGGIYQFIQLGQIFPKSLRDALYRYFAKNRYKWYGKKEECSIPSSEIKSKFLS